MRPPLVPLALALALALAGCTGDEGAPRADGSGRPESVRVIVRGVQLESGAENAIRVSFDSAEPVAEVLPSFDRPRARVHICPLTSLEATLPPETACLRDAPNGVRDAVRGRDMRGLAFVLVEGEPIGLDATLEFPERSRALSFAIPTLVMRGGSECSDNECNPVVEVQPLRPGTLTASARWSGDPATLAILQGRVLARAQSASGIRYREAAVDSGAPPLQVRAGVGTPSEYALVLRTATERSAAPVRLRDVRIDARWP